MSLIFKAIVNDFRWKLVNYKAATFFIDFNTRVSCKSLGFLTLPIS
jgi:hypothetical protein